jgi:hypothetical protein
MTTTSTSTNAMSERLKTMGITNGRKLADHVNAPAVIYFFMRGRDNGENDPRAELRYWAYDDNGEYQGTEIFRPAPGMPESAWVTVKKLRQNVVDQAKAYAAEELEIPVDTWHGAPFANCWIPRDSLNIIREEIGFPLIEEPVLH